MDRPELKPCPFCGGGKISIRVFDPYDGYQGNLTVHRIWCRNCGAQNERKDVMDAIEAWNKRTGYPCDLCEYGPPGSGDGWRGGKCQTVSIAESL